MVITDLISPRMCGIFEIFQTHVTINNESSERFHKIKKVATFSKVNIEVGDCSSKTL